MKNLIFIIIFLLFILLLACSERTSQKTLQESQDTIFTETEQVTPIHHEPVLSSTNPQIEMTIDNLDSIRIPVDSIVVKFTNNSDRELLYGAYFTVERENDGKWEQIWRNPGDTAELNVCFPAVGYVLFPHTSATYSNWTGFINKVFTKGKYRLTKTVLDAKEKRDDTLSVTFFIP